LRLRQAACHTGLLPGQVANTSSKVTALMEKLEEVVNSGHKALVFSQWTSLLDLIEPHLQEQNINFVRLDGSTQNRQDIVDQFQTSPEISIFLASLRAGGMGLNLTEADHVFLVDPWWNPAVEDQAADRAHRIGQTKPVIVYRLVAKDTVEEKILVLQDKKRQLADTALGDASQGSMLTKEDILALLQ
jgi:SNF2 family DNA or RNA helicase